jgi:transposase
VFHLDERLKVYLHREPVDFRLNINGLAALVQQALGLDPFAACVYVFSNRRAKQTTFSIPIAVCCDRVSMAPAARQEGSAVSTYG